MYFQLIETKCFQPRVNLMLTCTAPPRAIWRSAGIAATNTATAPASATAHAAPAAAAASSSRNSRPRAALLPARSSRANAPVAPPQAQRGGKLRVGTDDGVADARRERRRPGFGCSRVGRGRLRRLVDGRERVQLPLDGVHPGMPAGTAVVAEPHETVDLATGGAILPDG